MPMAASSLVPAGYRKSSTGYRALHLLGVFTAFAVMHLCISVAVLIAKVLLASID
jgi:hypothetical protein